MIEFIPKLLLVAGFVWFVFNPICSWLEKRRFLRDELNRAYADEIKRSRGML